MYSSIESFFISICDKKKTKTCVSQLITRSNELLERQDRGRLAETFLTVVSSSNNSPLPRRLTTRPYTHVYTYVRSTSVPLPPSFTHAMITTRIDEERGARTYRYTTTTDTALHRRMEGTSINRYVSARAAIIART